MRCREKLQEYLTSNGVGFEIEHHRLAYTAQQLAAAEHVSGKLVAKVVMAIANESPVMLVLPASSNVNLEKLKAELGARELRLAKEEEFATVFPDCEVGAMPPFGNLYGVPVYIDRSLTRAPEMVFPAGSHTESMKIRVGDYEKLVHPQVKEFAARQMAEIPEV
ncbi:MAG: aminoacyl-tRNA deacylase [Chloroflexota bacterium]